MKDKRGENALDLAYAVTVHKFQGSECPIIVIPFHRSQSPMLMQRNWTYTAISRASQVCVCLGQRREVTKSIRRTSAARRSTNLDYLLRQDAAKASQLYLPKGSGDV